MHVGDHLNTNSFAIVYIIETRPDLYVVTIRTILFNSAQLGRLALGYFLLSKADRYQNLNIVKRKIAFHLIYMLILLSPDKAFVSANVNYDEWFWII